jgi:GT2 family glycosyltransferase
VSADPDVSVCVVTWDNVSLTVDCLSSLYAHTRGPSFEVIVADNGSRDDTVPTVRRLFPGVRMVVSPENRGFSRAANQAIRMARGRYVLLLNNDTVLHEDAVAALAGYLDQHPGVGAVGCRLRLPDGRIQASAHADRAWWDYLVEAAYLDRLWPRHRLLGRTNMTCMDYETATQDVDWLVGAALMVRRTAVDDLGLLDERIVAFCEDWEWCVRFRHHGWRVVYFGGTEITHLLGGSSHSSASGKGDAVREWAVLTMNASADYVYRKLHPTHRARAVLFRATRRVFNLSRLVTHALLRVLGVRWERAAPLSAYWKAMVTPAAILERRYLHPPAAAGGAAEASRPAWTYPGGAAGPDRPPASPGP